MSSNKMKVRHHKLSPDDVDEIRRRLDMEVNPSRIARDFGVSYSQIRNIRLGKAWSPEVMTYVRNRTATN